MKQRKDILFLCQFFHPEYISSAQLPYETVQALCHAGFSVDVLCGYPREYYSGEAVPIKEESEGFGIHRLKYIQTRRTGFIGRLINYFSFTFALLLHIGEIGRYRAVAVYSNPPIAPWIAAISSRLFGTKLIFICYDAYPEVATRMSALRENSAIYRLMNHINRLVFSRADAVVALSAEMKEFLTMNRPICEERVQVIPNWADDIYSAKDTSNAMKAAFDGKFVVSYFGNMGTAQDMQTILGAIRLLKGEQNIHFLFAGHGNKKLEIEKIVASEGISNVTVRDFLQGQEFQNALAVSDAALVSLEEALSGICVPSKTYTYMMYGLPLLAVMGKGDIVDDIQSGAGICVQKGQSDALANAILMLSKQPELTESMGKRSRELYLQKYTREICSEKYVRMFRQILSR